MTENSMLRGVILFLLGVTLILTWAGLAQSAKHKHELHAMNIELLQTREQLSELVNRDFVIHIRGKQIELLDAAGIEALVPAIE